MGRHNSKCIDKSERRNLIRFLLDHGYVEQKGTGGSHTKYKNGKGDVKVITLNMNAMCAKRIRKEVLANV